MGQLKFYQRSKKRKNLCGQVADCKVIQHQSYMGKFCHGLALQDSTTEFAIFGIGVMAFCVTLRTNLGGNLAL